MTDTFEPQTIDLSASAVQLIRTALNNPKVTLDKTGLKSFDAAGNLVAAINADGTAQFAGVVNAAGVNLNQDSNPPTRADRRVRWLRLADGSVAADLEAFDAGNANPWGNIARFRSYDQNGVIVGIQLDSFVNTHRVLAQAGELSATVFDDGGKSSFPQLASPANVTIIGLLDTGVCPPLATNGETGIIVPLPTPIVAGRGNLAVAVGALYDGFFSAGFGWRYSFPDVNHLGITFHCLREGATADTAGWRGFVFAT